MAKESAEVPKSKVEGRVFQLGNTTERVKKVHPFSRANLHVVGMDDATKTESITAALKSKRLNNEIGREMKHGPVTLDVRGLQITDEDMQTLDVLNMKAVRKGSSLQVTVDTAEQSEQIRAAGIRRNGFRIVTEEQLNRGALNNKNTGKSDRNLAA